jgi:succinyl-CoA synthetase alpha subunit
MSILVDRKTRVLVQGITGSEGTFHTSQMLEYGTKIVGGVTPGKGGSTYKGKGDVKFKRAIKIFNTVQEAAASVKPDATIIFVPPPFAADAMLEAIDAKIKLIICITEGVPTKDMIKVYSALKDSDSRLIGPNCPGIITPNECKLGIQPGFIHTRGNVGVISRSGTLTYEAVKQLSDLGIGQSTVLGIGGDPIIGTQFIDAIKLFNEDPETWAILMIGEIGGNAEETAAEYVKKYVKKPVVGFIAGRTAPPGRRMGHAGAIISGGKGTAEDKTQALEAAGIRVVISPADIGKAVQEVLATAPKRRKRRKAKPKVGRPRKDAAKK